MCLGYPQVPPFPVRNILHVEFFAFFSSSRQLICKVLHALYFSSIVFINGLIILLVNVIVI